MYYVPDETKRCGYYECADCRQRFLDVWISLALFCPEEGCQVPLQGD
ncbi:MAG: hypothetical protein IJH60_07625 [Eubacterium sp.]|nr:hypothetical protein [Eubacterium sp.]